jgi:hypothetical protein
MQLRDTIGLAMWAGVSSVGALLSESPQSFGESFAVEIAFLCRGRLHLYQPSEDGVPDSNSLLSHGDGNSTANILLSSRQLA